MLHIVWMRRAVGASLWTTEWMVPGQLEALTAHAWHALLPDSLRRTP